MKLNVETEDFYYLTELFHTDFGAYKANKLILSGIKILNRNKNILWFV